MSGRLPQENADMLRQKRKLKRSDGQLPDCEWKFHGGRVPRDELVACCFWEYARESNFIREVVQNLKAVDQRKGSRKPMDAANRDLTRLYSIGTPAELFRRLPFPKPWQSLTLIQREMGKDFRVEMPQPVKFPPFQVTSDYFVASMLYGEASKAHDERQAAWVRLSQIDHGVTNLKEAAELRAWLAEQEKHQTPLLMRGMGGMDSFIGQINWRDFTDDEIIACFKQWVKARGARPVPVTQLPKGVRGLRGGKGKDPQEWRAMLERLGLLRLRSRYTLDDTLAILVRLPAKQREKTKFVEPGECNREAEKAVTNFRTIFPFHNPAKMPRSWPMK